MSPGKRQRISAMIEFLKIDGIESACWINDGGFIEGRRALVLVHGSGGDHTNWERQYADMKGDFNVVAVDLPGHGQSRGTGEQDVTLYMEWVKKIVEALTLKRPVVIGHSLGAAISLKFAITHGDMLSGIVPVGGGIRMPVNSLILDGIKTNPSSTLAMISKFSVHKKNRDRFMIRLINDISRADPVVTYGDFLSCDGFDITGEISRIQIPALIICGDDDKMTPPGYSKELKDTIKGARLSIIEDSGHFVMMENPDAFNSAVRDFVNSLE